MWTQAQASPKAAKLGGPKSVLSSWGMRVAETAGRAGPGRVGPGRAGTIRFFEHTLNNALALRASQKY